MSRRPRDRGQRRPPESLADVERSLADERISRGQQFSFLLHACCTGSMLGHPERSPSSETSRLATLTNASPSRLSHAARQLEARGLLVRAPDPDDGRCIRAVLTPEGVDVPASSNIGAGGFHDALDHEGKGRGRRGSGRR